MIRHTKPRAKSIWQTTASSVENDEARQTHLADELWNEVQRLPAYALRNEFPFVDRIIDHFAKDDSYRASDDKAKLRTIADIVICKTLERTSHEPFLRKVLAEVFPKERYIWRPGSQAAAKMVPSDLALTDEELLANFRVVLDANITSLCHDHSSSFNQINDLVERAKAVGREHKRVENARKSVGQAYAWIIGGNWAAVYMAARIMQAYGDCCFKGPGRGDRLSISTTIQIMVQGNRRGRVAEEPKDGQAVAELSLGAIQKTPLVRATGWVLPAQGRTRKPGGHRSNH